MEWGGDGAWRGGDKAWRYRVGRGSDWDRSRDRGRPGWDEAGWNGGHGDGMRALIASFAASSSSASSGGGTSCVPSSRKEV